LNAEFKQLHEQRKAFLQSVDVQIETAKVRMQQLQGAFQLLEKLSGEVKEIPKEK